MNAIVEHAHRMAMGELWMRTSTSMMQEVAFAMKLQGIRLTRGTIDFGDGWMAGRQTVDSAEELQLWTEFAEFSSKLNPKFHGVDRVANEDERVRRFAMFGLFHLIDFRSQDAAVAEMFRTNFGQMSLAWFMTSCGTLAPPWYYEWAFHSDGEVSGKVWGKKALQKFEGRPEWLAVFERLEPHKKALLNVRSVMRS